MLFNHYLVVQEWVPNFHPHSNTTKKILVWIRLPDLSIEYFDEKTLRKIGNKVGRTVKIDVTTGLATRGKFARICVEVDLTKPLLAKFTIEEDVLPIEYEGIHWICFICGTYGHRKEQCGQGSEFDRQAMGNHMEVDAGIGKANDAEYEPAMTKQLPVIKPHATEKFGNWMLVKRKDKRPNKRGSSEAS
ncbi:PREDICTED: uncharacterized protein LOC109151878 [Ipomoea nil]|uniref:uncharacterized protein LOC109151878 n=1 Tax=Ipomoea nil TaxID=35883 RepID=UPI00090161BE|nr:PREDICTED: uncharacterized protein LOC109151878 [Ipomoea nil]